MEESLLRGPGCVIYPSHGVAIPTPSFYRTVPLRHFDGSRATIEACLIGGDNGNERFVRKPKEEDPIHGWTENGERACESRDPQNRARHKESKIPRQKGDARRPRVHDR